MRNSSFASPLAKRLPERESISVMIFRENGKTILGYKRGECFSDLAIDFFVDDLLFMMFIDDELWAVKNLSLSNEQRAMLNEQRATSMSLIFNGLEPIKNERKNRN